MARILIVDDDEGVLRLVDKALSREGHEVRPLQHGAGAVDEAVSFEPELILLDIKMPDANGRDICQALKDEPRTSAVPVIFLTGEDAEPDVVLGFKLGAEDYVKKPFGVFELTARVEAALKRGERREDAARQVLKLGRLELDPDQRAVRVDRKPVALRPKEFDLLHLLLLNRERIVSRNSIIEALSRPGEEPLPRSIDVQVKNLRQKLGKLADWIETVPKAGYMLRRK